MTPEAFQDTLRKSVIALADKAKKANVKLPDRFFMGFEDYQASLPKPEAAAKLGRQLQAVEYALNILVDNKVDAINALRRTPLPEEGLATGTTGAPGVAAGGARGGEGEEGEPGGAGAARGAGPGGRGGGAGKAGQKQLVEKVPFEVEFISDPGKLRKSLNDIP